METHLAKSSHGLLVGDRITVADIACLGWVANHGKFLRQHYINYLVILYS
jgi:glutathione S-transferase